MYKSENRGRTHRSHSRNPLPVPLDKVLLMPRRLALVSLIVPAYDAAIQFFTSVGFDLTVEDTVGGGQKVYTNPDLTPATTVTDTAAFACQ